MCDRYVCIHVYTYCVSVCVYECVTGMCAYVHLLCECVCHNTCIEVKEQPQVLVFTYHLARGWVCLLLLLTAAYSRLASP